MKWRSVASYRSSLVGPSKSVQEQHKRESDVKVCKVIFDLSASWQYFETAQGNVVKDHTMGDRMTRPLCGLVITRQLYPYLIL